MAAWVIRQEREGEPKDAFQIEEIEVPEPQAFEVVVRVMAAGVNFNNVWASLGKPVSVFRSHPDEDHHIGGSDASGSGLEGRPRRHALEGRRRGRHPLQPGLLRGRRGPRPRPARRAEPEDLGLRDELGLVRAVLQGPGPAAAGQARAPDLGGGRLLRPDVLHRLPDAHGPGRPAGRPQGPHLGRRRRPRRVRDAAVRADRRRLRRRRLLRREGGARRSSSAPRTSSTATSSRG